ncbi:MAG: glycosyltransferase [Leptospiraceae bacterium]|nr:glycosyltransferase [Leptospiraceae bacterium]
MKILKVIHGYPPIFNAGSEVYSEMLCNELRKENEVIVFTREENPYLPEFHLRKEISERGVEIFFINIPRGKDGFRHPKMDSVFKNFIFAAKPDIAHIGHLNHLSTGIIDVLNEEQIPILYTLHDFWLLCPRGQFLQTNFGESEYYQVCDGQEDRKCATHCYNSYFTGISDTMEIEISNWTKWINSRMTEINRICEKIDLFLAPSRYLLQRYVNYSPIPKEKIKFIDYGFHLDRLQRVEDNRNTIFTFGYIGTHIPAKGVNLLIDAFKETSVKANLKIWGRENGQNTSSLKKKAESSKNKIEFMGEYQNEKISLEVFNCIDCLVVPSIWMENSPLVIHEAQQVRIPVITADQGGMKEFVEDGINGLLFKHRNLESLRDKMEYAATHPIQMKELAKRGYLYSTTGDIPSIEEHTKEIVKIYQSLL